MPEVHENKPCTIMKLCRRVIRMLCQIDTTYKEYVVMENGQEVIYVHITKAFYGLLLSVLQFYKKLSMDLIKQGYKINPYNPCVANKIIDETQHTVTWHINDLKFSHKDPKVNDQFIEWLNKKCGKLGDIKATRGPVHEYLGMTLDYSKKGQVSIDMRDYVNTMLNDFPATKSKKGKIKTP